MLTINYSIDKNRFELLFGFNSFSDQYEFNDFLAFLKSIYISFDPEKKVWYFSYDRIDEIILWFDRYNIKYDITTNTREEIEKIKDSYSLETKFFRKVSIDYSILNKDVELKDFQKQGILWALSRSNYGDFDDAGTGKSIQNIVIFSQRYKEKKIDGIILIVPGDLCLHWVTEILQFVNVFKKEDIQIIDNKNKLQPFENYTDKKILIFSNHLFSTSLLSYRKDFKVGKSQKKIQWKKSVDIKKLWNKKTIQVVVDESHSIKHTKAIKTKALHSVKYQFDYRALLTATPAINRFEDFYSQMSFIDKSIIRMSENAFKLYIATEIGDKYDKYNIIKYNIDIISKVLSDMDLFFKKRLKEDLPEMKVKKVINELPIDLSIIHRELYEYVCKNEIEILEEDNDEITLSMILNNPVIMEVLNNPFLLKKRNYTDENILRMLNNWDLKYDNKFQLLKSKLKYYVDLQNKKVITYGFHPSTLDMLFENFQQYNPLIIHGQIKTKDVQKYRNDVIDKFNNDDKYKLIILSSLTSSAGLNLQKSCSNIVVYETVDDATHFRQLQDRTFRIVSIVDSLIEAMYYRSTLEKKKIDKIFNRAELNDNINKKLSLEDLRSLLNGE